MNYTITRIDKRTDESEVIAQAVRLSIALDILTGLRLYADRCRKPFYEYTIYDERLKEICYNTQE